IGIERDQLLREAPDLLEVGARPARLDRKIAADRPAQLIQPFPQCGEPPLRLGVGFGCTGQDADPPHRLLRAGDERPSRRAAEKRDEFAASHSITSSASAISRGGTSRPSALAVLRLITRSNAVGCTTGRSPTFSPLSTRPA